jgi:hypothetical protein
MLSDILRDESRWPPGFVWDYSYCGRCAMGLAARLWLGYQTGLIDAPAVAARAMADAFHMPVKAAYAIFTNLKFPNYESVSPGDVADAIDAYLAHGCAAVIR